MNTDMVALYNVGLADGPGESFESRALGMKSRKVPMTIIIPFCDLSFVIMFRLIVYFLLDQWPVTTGQGDNTKVRFLKTANKMCSR